MKIGVINGALCVPKPFYLVTTERGDSETNVSHPRPHSEISRLGYTFYQDLISNAMSKVCNLCASRIFIF